MAWFFFRICLTRRRRALQSPAPLGFSCPGPSPCQVDTKRGAQRRLAVWPSGRLPVRARRSFSLTQLLVVTASVLLLIGVFLILAVAFLQAHTAGLNDLVGGQAVPEPFCRNCNNCCSSDQKFNCLGGVGCTNFIVYRCIEGSDRSCDVVSLEVCNNQHPDCNVTPECFCY